jgi:endonuclease/exonuclease/phosphatase family metal-dependent hydrolase
VWNTERLEVRRAPLEALLRRSPDVLAVQELRPEIARLIERCLPHHHAVTDPLTGWTSEGNLWWDGRILEERSHGATDYGAPELDRRLFWVRLHHLASGQELVAASAHLTWPGGGDESLQGRNPRLAQMQAIVDALDAIADGLPTVLMGDMNDPVVPPRVARAAGFTASWDALGTMPPAPYPAGTWDDGWHPPTPQPDGEWAWDEAGQTWVEDAGFA